MNDYLLGSKLFGDDFSLDSIKQWYDDESEGYADLGSNDSATYSYGYHAVNTMYGFDKIDKNQTFDHVLGFGSAWGHEFEPIISQISAITIIEPSEQLVSKSIGAIVPTYVKPTIDGVLNFDADTFDMVTCFGTLHHIPNVSFVLSEFIRVLKPGGILLLREPIISMGDWNSMRPGLTKNERGIPLPFFKAFFKGKPVQVISCNSCFTMTSLFQRALGKMFRRPIYTYKSYLWIDRLLSLAFAKNITYHATSKLSRIAPSSVFFVVKKV